MRKILAIALIIMMTISVKAQENSLRLGIFGLPYGGINLKYERSLADNMSIGLTAGVLVPRRLKFAENIINSQSQDTAGLESKIGGFSLIPEFRFYPKNDGLRGFYVAPAFHYSYNSMNLFLVNGNDTYQLNSKVNGVGGSVSIGYQWVIGSGFTLDWNIFGLGVNNYFTNTVVTGQTDEEITQADADDLESTLRGVFYLGNGVKEVNYNEANSKLDVKMSNLIPHFRMAFSVGYSF